MSQEFCIYTRLQGWRIESKLHNLRYSCVSYRVRPFVGSIKSANILLDGRLQARIGDFGLVRSVPGAQKNTIRVSSVLMTANVIGTWAYMPPEAMQGELTAATDVWSMGLVLLELLTGLPVVDEHHQPSHIRMRMEDILDDHQQMLARADVNAGSWSLDVVAKLCVLADGCLQERRKKRHKMDQLLNGLNEVVLQLVHQEVEGGSGEPVCVVCEENTAMMVIVPCGHCCLCEEHAQSFGPNTTQKVCPSCHTTIDSIVKLYR